MKMIFQFLFLVSVWNQASMAGVDGWHVWRVDARPWRIEATVTEASYQVPMVDAMAIYTVSSFNAAGDSFAKAPKANVQLPTLNIQRRTGRILTPRLQ